MIKWNLIVGPVPINALLRHVLKRVKNNFPIFAIFCFRDMVDFVLKILKILTEKRILMSNCYIPKDAHCSKTNAKSIFRCLRFLIFKIWWILYSKFLVNWGLSEPEKPPDLETLTSDT